LAADRSAAPQFAAGGIRRAPLRLLDLLLQVLRPLLQLPYSLTRFAQVLGVSASGDPGFPDRRVGVVRGLLETARETLEGDAREAEPRRHGACGAAKALGRVLEARGHAIETVDRVHDRPRISLGHLDSGCRGRAHAFSERGSA
jgi:hypothetical protein